jgi:hypothetical protein
VKKIRCSDYQENYFNINSNKYHTTDMDEEKTLIVSTPTAPSIEASFAESRIPSISNLKMTESHGSIDESMNHVDMGSMEADIISVNDSTSEEGFTRRSTNSGQWRNPNGERDESRLSSPREQLASEETRAVTNLKLLVFGSLFCSMVAVVLTAYFLTSQAEQNTFELTVYDDANKILGNMGHNVQRTMEAADAFIASITSFAAHTNQTWPFVVIPDFAVTAEKIRSLCGGVYVAKYHLVETEQRKEWENFTATVGTEMVDEAIAAIAEYNVMDWPITTNYTPWNVIYDYDEFDKENKV